MIVARVNFHVSFVTVCVIVWLPPRPSTCHEAKYVLGWIRHYFRSSWQPLSCTLCQICGFVVQWSKLGLSVYILYLAALGFYIYARSMFTIPAGPTAAYGWAVLGAECLASVSMILHGLYILPQRVSYVPQVRRTGSLTHAEAHISMWAN
jgi:hypothetical protein